METLLTCSFCGKEQNQVAKLWLNSRNRVAICIECAELIVEETHEEMERAKRKG